MMNYNVIAYYDDATITCETNDINVALTFLLEHSDVHIEVIDGFTGEILCAHDLVRHVRGKEKVEFIPADHSGELYKKVEVNCWTVTDKYLADHFRSYCGSMAALYSAQMLAL